MLILVVRNFDICLSIKFFTIILGFFCLFFKEKLECQGIINLSLDTISEFSLNNFLIVLTPENGTY